MHRLIWSFMLCLFTFINTANSCSRILYTNESLGVMVGRSMDWNTDLAQLMQTNLIVYPRGIERNGNTATNPLHWKARYGSLVATALHDTIAVDGINEFGLAAHTLWFELADYGKRNDQLPGLSVTMWVQFALDNFNSVDEAVNYFQTQPLQITSFTIPNTNQNAPQHLVLEDVSGDSAIIEYIDGIAKIYHDKKYVVATNEPAYPQQLANLEHFVGLGGDKPLPGTVSPEDRFVRGSYYLAHLPKAKTITGAISEIKSVLNSMAEPFEEKSDATPNPIPTIWYIIADLTHTTYYFQDINKMNMIWVELDQFNLSPNAPAMKLNMVNRDDLVGDVTKQFKIK